MDRRSFMMTGAGVLGRLALPAGLVAVAGCSGAAKPPGTVGFDGATMGTGYSVRLAVPLETERLHELEEAVRAALSAVDARMSTYDTHAELARFNRSQDTDWQPLSADTLTVLAHAVQTSRASHGAFDATVGPLVNLWGFGPDGAVDRVPAGRDVALMLERVGWRHLELDPARGPARKTRANAYVDLSGIAKGYGVDAVVRLLTARGVEDFLVEVGGELASRGQRPGGDPWRVAIEQPSATGRRVQRLVDIKGRTIATSGDYRNFFDAGGQRYSHAIDPRDGRPVAHTLASVSVIADDATDADAISTALMVMGPESGPEWARERDLAALFVVHDGTAYREVVTPGFEPHLAV